MIRTHQWRTPCLKTTKFTLSGLSGSGRTAQSHVAEVHSNLYFLFTFNRVGILNLIDHVQCYVELEISWE